MNVKAIIFDLDGVLTDTAVHHFHAWKALAEHLGVSFNEQDNEALKGVSRLDSLLRILDKGGLDPAQYDLESLMAKKNALYLEEVNKLTPADQFPGVAELLRELRAQNYLLGVASASKNAALVLSKIQLIEYFDVIGDAAAVAHSKPAPDIFLQVAERLAVAPEHCVGVEDARSGIEAIISAGMFPVGIGQADQLVQAKLIYSNTNQLSIEDIITVNN
jgi:beta-phosphoglucomutase